MTAEQRSIYDPWTEWHASGSLRAVPKFNAPWRGQMAKAWRAVKACRQSWHDGYVAYNCPLTARELHAKERWHREWYDYGRSLRERAEPNVTAAVNDLFPLPSPRR
jgi:hypothetical protein